MAGTNVVDRLRKLIAMEESARKIGNQAEAEAFAAKVAEMLVAHRLERSDVEVQVRDAEPIGETRVPADETGWEKQTRSVIEWMVAIARGCGNATGCGLLWGSSNNAAVFVGKKEDRDAARELYVHFVGLAQVLCWKEGQKAKPSIVSSCKAMWGEGSFGRQSQAMKEFRASYCSGFGSALGERLTATAKKAIEETATSAAMVWVRKDQAAIDQYVGAIKGKCTPKPEFNRHNTQAYHAGRAMGDKVALTGKVLR